MKKFTIGVFAPSNPAHIWFAPKYEYAKSRLIELGFNIKEGKLVKNRNLQGYRTASGKERANELMDLILDKDVDILMPVIGGYNSSSLIPYLDFEIIEKSKKILCGYSDITSLHMAFLSKTTLPTIYGGSLIPTFGEYHSKNIFGENSFLQALNKKSYEIVEPEKWSNQLLNAFTDAWKDKREYQKNDGWKILNEGNVSGKVIAANINTLVSLFGSEYVPDFKDCILILEEMNASIAEEERSLNALKLYGVFDTIKGLIFSKPEIYDDKGSNIKYEELISEIIGKRDYPIVYNFDCGHTIPSICIPQNSLINLVAEKNIVKINLTDNSILNIK